MRSPRLELKHSQKLLLTQTMRQSLEILQLSAADLQALVSAELDQNPALEAVFDAPARLSGSGMHDAKLSERNRGDEGTPAGGPGGVRAEYERFVDQRFLPSSGADGNRQFLENTIRQDESLQDVLIRQARLVALDDRELDLYERIITSLDENGFLEVGPEEIAGGASVPAEEVRRIIAVVQEFEPLGCGSAGMRDALLSQARNRFPSDQLLSDMIERHFNDLDEVRYDRIAKGLGVTLGEVLSRIAIIRRLDPFPGRQFSRRIAQQVIPDVEVRLVDGRIDVIMMKDWIPELSINSHYSRLARQKKIEKNQKEYIQGKLQLARSLIRNIGTRRATIARVVGIIMERQRSFLEHGPGHLMPLTSREIAEELGCHESTVSRTVNGKYAQTAWGIFELKHFFASRVRAQQEEVSSSDRVMALIRDAISREAPDSPLSDADIVNKIREQGIFPSRRTIAKYRGALSIPPAHKRRRINLYMKGEVL